MKRARCTGGKTAETEEQRHGRSKRRRRSCAVCGHAAIVWCSATCDVVDDADSSVGSTWSVDARLPVWQHVAAPFREAAGGPSCLPRMRALFAQAAAAPASRPKPVRVAKNVAPPPSEVPSTSYVREVTAALQQWHDVVRLVPPTSLARVQAGSGEAAVDMLVCNTGQRAQSVSMLDRQFIVPRRSQFVCGDVGRLRDIAAMRRNWARLLVADPPWPNKSVARSKAYHTMSYRMLNKLRRLPMATLLVPGAIVAVWITHDPRARATVLDHWFPAWRVRHVTEWLWLKVTHGRRDPVLPVPATCGCTGRNRRHADARKPWECVLLGVYEPHASDDATRAAATAGDGASPMSVTAHGASAAAMAGDGASPMSVTAHGARAAATAGDGASPTAVTATAEGADPTAVTAASAAATAGDGASPTSVAATAAPVQSTCPTSKAAPSPCSTSKAASSPRTSKAAPPPCPAPTDATRLPVQPRAFAASPVVHSMKPPLAPLLDEWLPAAEGALPDKLELFARRLRPGWLSLGHQCVLFQGEELYHGHQAAQPLPR